MSRTASQTPSRAKNDAVPPTPTAMPKPDSTRPMTAADRSASARERFDVAAKHLYFIGIGGCGMSGLARMLRERGGMVSGSDKDPSDATATLIDEGISVGFDQATRALPEACDLVVASAAIKPDHPQVLAAIDRGIPVLTYAEALGKSMLGTTGVAVAGTHGKSSTVAMLGHILIQSRLEPTVIVGATCAQLGDAPDRTNGTERTDALQAAPRTPHAAPTGFRLGAPTIPIGPLAGEPGLLLAEACEFNRSFHNYKPVIGAIMSVEADHLDIYGTLDAVVESFHHFAKLVAPAKLGGRLLIAHDGAHRRTVTAGLECEVFTLGYNPAADYHVTFDQPSRTVHLRHQGADVLSWTLNIPGDHMAMNSAYAATIALWLGAEPARIAAALANFRGVDRRMQKLGVKDLSPISKVTTRVRGLHLADQSTSQRTGSSEPHAAPRFAGGAHADPTLGVTVYDDYGHHPTEIDCTLRALREFEKPETRNGRLICVFQPHQHSRTRHLLEEFTQSFSHADIVIVPHIYFVRDSEAEKQKISSQDLVDRLRKKGVHAMHLYPFEAIVEQLQNICRPGDLLVVMGAGPVWQVAHAFMKAGM